MPVVNTGRSDFRLAPFLPGIVTAGIPRLGHSAGACVATTIGKETRK